MPKNVKKRKKSSYKKSEFREPDESFGEKPAIIIKNMGNTCLIKNQQGMEILSIFTIRTNRKKNPEGQWCLYNYHDTNKGKDRYRVTHVYRDSDIKMLKKLNISFDDENDSRLDNIVFEDPSPKFDFESI